MSETFIISDHHFDHKKILEFEDTNGKRFRGDRFPFGLAQMHAEMIDIWNDVVSPKDKVYHVGDFCISDTHDKIKRFASMLNGTKILIRGNHDKARLPTYLESFKDVRGCHLMQHKDLIFVMTHMPVHERSISKKHWINLHGHIHERSDYGKKWMNMCVERWDYKPVHIETIYNLAKEKLNSED